MANDVELKPTNIEPYKREENDTDEGFLDLLHNWNYLKDEIVLFLGAGASIGARNINSEPLPNAFELRNQIFENFVLEAAQKGKFDFRNLGLTSLESASTLAEIKSSRRNLERYIATKFEVTKTLWHHAMLPYLNAKAIFTTNYDTLIETGFHSTNYGKKLNVIFNNTTSTNSRMLPLYKPHGSIDYPHSRVTDGGFVITQFDYYDIMETRREMLENFMADFHDKCVIFIGYSLSDFDIASIIYRKSQQVNKQAWYAVFPRNDTTVKNMFRDKFGIRQINKSFFNFIYDLDKAINFIPDNDKFKNCNRNLYQ